MMLFITITKNKKDSGENKIDGIVHYRKKSLRLPKVNSFDMLKLKSFTKNSLICL